MDVGTSSNAGAVAGAGIQMPWRAMPLFELFLAVEGAYHHFMLFVLFHIPVIWFPAIHAGMMALLLVNLMTIAVQPRASHLTRISHQDLEFWDKLAKQVGRSAAEA